MVTDNIGHPILSRRLRAPRNARTGIASSATSIHPLLHLSTPGQLYNHCTGILMRANRYPAQVLGDLPLWAPPGPITGHVHCLTSPRKPAVWPAQRTSQLRNRRLAARRGRRPPKERAPTSSRCQVGG